MGQQATSRRDWTRENKIIRMSQNRTIKEIAKAFDVTPQRIGQILERNNVKPFRPNRRKKFVYRKAPRQPR
jgi:DNA-directed RNA polymerase sigma subunit (sigma70/sigma32)